MWKCPSVRDSVKGWHKHWTDEYCTLRLVKLNSKSNFYFLKKHFAKNMTWQWGDLKERTKQDIFGEVYDKIQIFWKS